MAVPMVVLRGLEILNTLGHEPLAEVAELAELVQCGQSDYVYRSGMRRDRAFFVKSGLVGVYVTGQAGDLIPTEICGPSKALSFAALFSRGAWQLSAMALMPTTLVALSARAIQGLLLSRPEASVEVYESTLRVYERRLSNLIRALTSEDVSVTVEEQCPSERTTHMVLSVNTRTGLVRALCQREFSCSLAEGKGCPIAEMPAHEFHEIAPGHLQPVERSA